MVLTEAAHAPTPTPLPRLPSRPQTTQDRDTEHVGAIVSEQGAAARYSQPVVRFEVLDTLHPGAVAFGEAVQTAPLLTNCIQRVLALLYGRAPKPVPEFEGDASARPPRVRVLCLRLKPFDGVARTFGDDLDDLHKTIEFSTTFLSELPPSKRISEIYGVVTHELVHCFQYDGQKKAPRGLTEGIADWVRLRAGLAPAHWKRQVDGTWDGGYAKTAYFLEYLEGRYGEGTVRRMNARLREEYFEDKYWEGLFGLPVSELWADYATGGNDGSE